MTRHSFFPSLKNEGSVEEMTIDSPWSVTLPLSSLKNEGSVEEYTLGRELEALPKLSLIEE